MSELEAFRTETRAWLEDNCPPGARNIPLGGENICWGGRRWIFRDEDQRLWFERMRDRRWTVPTWPAEYGGGGLDRERARILQQELRHINAASPLDSLGIWMLGPALLEFGTEVQKQKYLPEIARGEIRWAQGYSEPGAGSDLANVQTKGEDKGDHFLVNGSKIWTSYGDKADMIFALVRTEPDASKHLGISFLLIDMDDPGVTTKPIRLIAGDSPFTQTFFDNIRVPKENIVGERGRGWDVTKYLLGHERAMIGSGMSTTVTEPLPVVAARLLGAAGLARQAALRDAVIRHEVNAWAMAIAIERNRDQAKAGRMPPAAPSMLKVHGTELAYRRAELMMSLGGSAALDPHGAAAHDWLHAPANCLGGGSSEIQLNIIAKRELGLPGS